MLHELQIIAIKAKVCTTHSFNKKYLYDPSRKYTEPKPNVMREVKILRGGVKYLIIWTQKTWCDKERITAVTQ